MTDAIQLLIRERDAPKEFLKARIAVQRVEGVDLQAHHCAIAWVITFLRLLNSLVKFSQLREYNSASP
jgi:hypothetical protein